MQICRIVFGSHTDVRSIIIGLENSYFAIIQTRGQTVNYEHEKQPWHWTAARSLGNTIFQLAIIASPIKPHPTISNESYAISANYDVGEVGITHGAQNRRQ